MFTMTLVRQFDPVVAIIDMDNIASLIEMYIFNSWRPRTPSEIELFTFEVWKGESEKQQKKDTNLHSTNTLPQKFQS